MKEKGKTESPASDNAASSWIGPGEPFQGRVSGPESKGTDPEINEKISTLVESFEERIGKLKAHISDLEARLDELRIAKDRVRSAFDEFLNVQELSEMVRSTQDPAKVVEALTNLIRRFVEYDAMGIFLFDRKRGGLESLGPTPARISRAARSQYDEGIIDWVISERRPIVVPWTESFGEVAEETAKNLVIAPLMVGDEAYGVCLLSTSRHPERFSAHELKLLFFAVSHAAAAIQNAMRTRDITSTKDFLSNLLENAGDIIFSLDQQGKFSYVNPQVEELGYRKEDLLEQHFKVLFRQPEVEKRIQSTLQLGSKQLFDIELRSSTGRSQQFTVNLVPLKGEKSRWIGALGIMRNVTEINRLQKRLLESGRLAAYTQTVITLNHEINNPLTTVLGNIFLMERDAEGLDNEKLTKRLKVIQENCIRIQKVIKKLERIDELKTVSYLGDTKMVDIGNEAEDS